MWHVVDYDRMIRRGYKSSEHHYMSVESTHTYMPVDIWDSRYKMNPAGRVPYINIIQYLVVFISRYFPEGTLVHVIHCTGEVTTVEVTFAFWKTDEYNPASSIFFGDLFRCAQKTPCNVFIIFNALIPICRPTICY